MTTCATCGGESYNSRSGNCRERDAEPCALRAELRDVKAERDALRLESDGHRSARDARTGERDDLHIALRDLRAAVLAVADAMAGNTLAPSAGTMRRYVAELRRACGVGT